MEPQPHAPLKITITGDIVINDQKPYTFFSVSVVAGDSSWTIARRYRQFRELHNKLSPLIPSTFQASFPSRTFVGDKLDRSVVEKRKRQLQIWLDELVTIPEVVNSPVFTKFLDPNEQPPAKFLIATCFGYLVKISETKSLSTKVAVTNKRWFALQGNTLYYYKTEQSSEPSGVIDLATAKIDAGKDRTIVIQNEEGTYTLRAESEEEMQEWVIALRQSRIGSDSLNENYLRFLNSVQRNTGSNDSEVKEMKRLQLLEFLTKPASVYDNTMLNRKLPPIPARQSMRGSVTVPPSNPPSQIALILQVVEDDSENNILFKTMEDGTTRLRGATLEKLLEKLCDWSFGDSDFIEAFLYTFNSFMTPHDLLQYLVSMFRNPPLRPQKLHDSVLPPLEHDPMRARILVVLSKWLEVHIYDFLYDSILTNKLLAFISENAEKSGLQQAAAKQLRGQLQLKLGKKETEADLVDAPAPILPNLFATGTFDFFDLDPIEFARQLTVLQHSLFKDIPLKEFLCQGWNKKEKAQQLAPNLLKMIAQFNRVSRWVASMIVRARHPKQRSFLISRFIDVANECRKLRNYDTIAQITAGLQNASVFRLKASWKNVSSEKKEIFEELIELFNSANNFERYRTTLKQSIPPCLPYIGSYLTDLTFIEDGNPDFICEKRKLINFEKRLLLAKVLAEIQKFQSVRYCIRPVHQIQEYLKNLSWMEEDELYKLSLEREPRSPS